MFIVNQCGRIVDLPEEMEESGFKQAKVVLSISDSLMENGNYVAPSGGQGGVLVSKSGRNLRNDILAKFPDVIRDSEYIERHVNAEETKLIVPKNDRSKVRRNAKTTKVSSKR